mmetsp:Transcript_69/g.158  ORF Transcript_69/g.158 Transcript_69/m.158 type:complete len:530 (-) Transcript_69:277-1866(-)
MKVGWLWPLIFLVCTAKRNSKFAIVDVQGPPELAGAVIGMYGDFGSRITEDTKLMEIVPAEPLDGCSKVSKNLLGKIVVMWRGNCTYAEKALAAEAAGASACIIVDDAGVLDAMNGGRLGDQIKIPTLKVKRGNWAKLKHKPYATGRIRLYYPPSFDIAEVLVSLLATVIVVGGAYWSASGFQRTSESRLEHNFIRYTDSVDPPLALKESYAWGFIIATAVLLVVLFRFMSVIHYILLGVYFIAGAVGIQSCTGYFLSTFEVFSKTSCGSNSALALSCLLAVAVAVWAAASRGQWYTWVLQDVLGTAFLLMLQRIVHLPSIKGSTILLSLALLYNVFLIFFAPHLSYASRDQAGFGPDATPLLLRIPYLNSSFPQIEYAVFGLGDIGIPGLYVSNLLQLDLKRNLWVPQWPEYGHLGKSRLQKTGYCVYAICGYIAGVLTINAIELVTDQVQPSLMYLVPFLFAPVFATAYLRGDLRSLWDEDYEIDGVDPQTFNADGYMTECSDYESLEHSTKAYVLEKQQRHDLKSY